MHAKYPYRAHPRSRGADFPFDNLIHSTPGSSPLARGGQAAGSADSRSAGLIPARAGRTADGHEGSAHAGAHPRSRGADMVGESDGMEKVGSSPLARGGHTEANLAGDAHGLIPARAGRTRCASACSRQHGAHPRSRGADDDEYGSETFEVGSSPLARGGLSCSCRCSAYARAHPRSRGADDIPSAAPMRAVGSSPLARGGP